MNFGHNLHRALDKLIQDQFKPRQQNTNHGYGNYMSQGNMDKLFHIHDCANVTDIAKIDHTIKTLWDPNNTTKKLAVGLLPLYFCIDQ